MSKGVCNKTAKFILEPDGFSIHTFEIWKRLKHGEYRDIREYLYKLNDLDGRTCTYPNDWKNIVCSAFSRHGIGVTLEENNGTDSTQKVYGIRIFVSPRRLLDPDTSYLGILEPTDCAVDYVAKKFHKLFKNTPIPPDMDKFIATRVDLCTNIRCSHAKLFRELVRVIHKLPTPPKYRRKFRKRDTKGLDSKKRKAIQKEDNKYNKHYFKVSCDSCDLVIYDKGYQVTAEGLEELGYENLPNSVLRLECRVRRSILRKIEKRQKTDGCVELLKYLTMNSEPLLSAAFSNYFAWEPFCRYSEIEKTVQESWYSKCTKATMLELSKRLQRGQIMDNVFDRMERDGWEFDRKKLMQKFQELGINPIPLWKNFCAPRLPSPVELLQEISGTNIAVPYTVIK